MEGIGEVELTGTARGGPPEVRRDPATGVLVVRFALQSGGRTFDVRLDLGEGRGPERALALEMCADASLRVTVSGRGGACGRPQAVDGGSMRRADGGDGAA